MENTLLRAVDIQREGAADPAQHGATPPIAMPKREVTRFLERIADFEKEREKAEAKREEERTAAEMKKADAVDESAIIAPGTKRSNFRAAAEMLQDAQYDDFLGDELSSDDESFNGSGGSGGGGSGDGDGDDDDDDDDDENSAEVFSDGDEEEGEDGVRKTRSSKRQAARTHVTRSARRSSGAASRRWRRAAAAAPTASSTTRGAARMTITTSAQATTRIARRNQPARARRGGRGGRGRGAERRLRR